MNDFSLAEKINRQINLVNEPRAYRVASTYALQGLLTQRILMEIVSY